MCGPAVSEGRARASGEAEDQEVIITLDRCALCPGINTCVPPSGPLENCDELFIGEAPGRDENKAGVPFVGKTGREVNEHYLPLAGLRREAVPFTNAIRCWPTTNGGKLDPKSKRDQALLECCTNTFLYPLIERMQPKTLVPMGSFACTAIDPEIDLELQHGMPVETRLGLAFPMYHPAQGMHEPKKMLMLRTDWQRLRSYRNGTLLMPIDELEPDYAEATPLDIAALDPTQPLAGDTEVIRHREPFCLTFSQSAGTGRLIRASDTHLLSALQTKLDHWESVVLFHNWLFDAPITQAMGLQFPPRHIVDTMVRVFHLGNLPQGLKALAYRELGMQMQDFDDLVRPHSEPLVLRYYRDAYGRDWPKPEQDLVRGDDGKWTLYKPQGINTKLKRFFTDYVKADGKKDVFKTWDNWEAEQPMIEAECGEFPNLCITHVPFEQVLHYACRDADALIRLYPIIKKMSTFVRRFSQDQWRRHAA